MKIQTALYQHQKELLRFALARNISFDCSETGIGKTLVAIALAAHRLRNKHIDQVISIVPKSVELTWRDELEKHIGWLPKEFTIMSYDKVRFHKGRCLPAFDPETTLLILDEFRYVKNYTAQRTRVIQQLSSIKYKHFLDGSPATKPIDLFMPFQIANVWPFSAMSINRFKSEFLYRDGSVKRFKGSALREAIQRFMIRKTKDQCLDLPPKIYSTRWYQLSKEQERIYRQILRNLRIEFEQENNPTGTFVSRFLNRTAKLAQICGGFCYTEGPTWWSKKNPKLECLNELLDELLDKPLIIWVVYDAEEEMIGRLLRQRQESYVVFSGKQTPAAKRRAFDSFQQGCSRIFLAKLQSAGTGLNLQRAEAAIYFSNVLSPSTIRYQSEDRAHRADSEHKLMIYDILAANRADALIKEKIDKNWSDAELLMALMSH
jgi:SNF2 family DNA or RNA helicase